MLDSGYPRQSSAFHKIAGIRTNFTVPAVHSIALGGGSICRVHCDQTSVGPDSVGAELEKESIYFGGKTLTVSPVPLTKRESREYLSVAKGARTWQELKI